MSSKVDICNMALIHVGAMPSVVSLDPPDGGAYALHCARFYPIALNQLLALPFQFAMKRTALDLVEENPNDQWLYSYSIPSDCVRTFHVLPSGVTSDNDGIEFIVEGQRIFCDQPYVSLLYTTSEVTAGNFTPLFADALSRLLAYFLSVPVMKASGAERQAYYKLAQQSIGYAASVDAMSRKQKDVDHIPIWMRNR
jgi:hypothetical protein